jgi:hypothetical protein
LIANKYTDTYTLKSLVLYEGKYQKRGKEVMVAGLWIMDNSDNMGEVDNMLIGYLNGL